MNQTLLVKQLSERVSHLEAEVQNLRNELAKLRPQAKHLAEAAISSNAFSWRDKEIQKQTINQIFTSLSIHSRPIGPQALQQKMSQAGLKQDELSRSLIEAREE